MREHPSIEEIVDYCLTGEGAAVRTDAAAHLSGGCPKCRARVRQLRQVIDALRAPSFQEVPEGVRERARRWLEAEEARQADRTAREGTAAVRVRQGQASARSEARSVTASTKSTFRAAAASAASAVEEVRAFLVLDTAAGALLPGIRGGTVSASRQLLYESAAGQVHLQIDPRGLRFEVRGLFVPTGDERPEGRAILWGKGLSRTRRLSAGGEFNFRQLGSGSVRLDVESGGRRVICEPIELAAPGDG